MSADEITFYISIISSFLLAVSEILPYIKSIEANGIIETFINIIKKKTNDYIVVHNSDNSNNLLVPEQNNERVITILNDILTEIKSSKEFFHNHLNDSQQL